MSKQVDDIININVIIADRPYPLKIKQSEEEDVRKAAKEVNEKVTHFQQVYAAKDKQDYLAMSALMYAVQILDNKKKSIENDADYEQEMQEIEKLLTQ